MDPGPVWCVAGMNDRIVHVLELHELFTSVISVGGQTQARSNVQEVTHDANSYRL
jgi:hypothetical protein